MPGGSWTYWAGLVPFSWRALPNLPGTRGRSAGATQLAGVATIVLSYPPENGG